MFNGTLSSGAKCAVALVGVGWAVCATLWLIALSAQGHCPMARTTRVVTNQAIDFPLRVMLNQSFTSESPTTPQLSSSSGSSRDEVLRYYTSLIYSGNDVGKEGCTMVMLTYKRESLLPRVLKHYCKVAVLKRIVVVWNDVDTAWPKSLLDLTAQCPVDLKFIQSSKNRLTNRYIPRDEIETECVCLMDDDRMVEVADMNFGFEVWKSNRHRVVGFEERGFVQDANGKYIYTNYERRRFLKNMVVKADTGRLPAGYSIEIKDGTRYLHVKNKTFILGPSGSAKAVKPGNTPISSQANSSSQNVTQKSEGYNIMLNSCFLHKAYLKMYFDPVMVPSSLVEYVNQEQNCEDILMSVVATKFLKDIGRPQCGVLAVKSGWISDLDEEAHDQGGREGLSSRPDHYKARSACLEKFSQTFGYLPLHTSRLIMTKVTYHL